ncbi:hypothetical protein ACJX0J_022874, partial [Zea mays]
ETDTLSLTLRLKSQRIWPLYITDSKFAESGRSIAKQAHSTCTAGAVSIMNQIMGYKQRHVAQNFMQVSFPTTGTTRGILTDVEKCYQELCGLFEHTIHFIDPLKTIRSNKDDTHSTNMEVTQFDAGR